jgi:hypothetical protein
LGRRSKAEAEEALREAATEREEGSWHDGDAMLGFLLFLPLVEEIDPALVPEFLWRALSLRPADLGRNDPRIVNAIRVVTVVAHYDREFAATLWTPIKKRRQSLEPQDPFRASYGPIVAEAQLDPRAAVAWLESLPKVAIARHTGQNDPRVVLANILALWSLGRKESLLPYVIGPVEELGRRDLR